MSPEPALASRRFEASCAKALQCPGLCRCVMTMGSATAGSLTESILCSIRCDTIRSGTVRKHLH
jgi:hypothetical protein